MWKDLYIFTVSNPDNFSKQNLVFWYETSIFCSIFCNRNQFSFKWIDKNANISIAMIQGVSKNIHWERCAVMHEECIWPIRKRNTVPLPHTNQLEKGTPCLQPIRNKNAMPHALRHNVMFFETPYPVWCYV